MHFLEMWYKIDNSQELISIFVSFKLPDVLNYRNLHFKIRIICANICIWLYHKNDRKIITNFILDKYFYDK